MSNVRKYLDLSTAHVSPAAREWLKEQAELNNGGDDEHWCWHVASHVHGWWMNVGTDDEEGDMDSIHPDLLAVCKHARDLDCYFILFDSDGDQIDGLPIYDWNA